MCLKLHLVLETGNYLDGRMNNWYVLGPSSIFYPITTFWNSLKWNVIQQINKEAFHTARLPSSTSQLVLFHHLFCIHFWGGGSTSVITSGGGSTSMFTSRGGPLPCSLLGVHFHVHFWGVHFHVHFWGGVPLPCSLLGGGPMWPTP